MKILYAYELLFHLGINALRMQRSHYKICYKKFYDKLGSGSHSALVIWLIEKQKILSKIPGENKQTSKQKKQHWKGENSDVCSVCSRLRILHLR